MGTIAHVADPVTVGVDTHGETHLAAVVDAVGRILGTTQVCADPDGYRKLVRFAEGHGRIARVGVEGTGAYGAGLARYLSRRGYEVVEVDRPDRRVRRTVSGARPRSPICAGWLLCRRRLASRPGTG